MAVQGVNPPKFLPGTQIVSAWKEYKADFLMYLSASGMMNSGDEQKISLLLYQMGRQFIKVYENELVFAPPEDKKKFN